MKNLTPEMIEKAKAAKSAEELLEIAKANNIEMTADEAKTYFAQLNPKSGELSDDDLDSVAGGACQKTDDSPLLGKTVRITDGATCKKCGTNIGIVDKVYSAYGLCLGAVCQNCRFVINDIQDGNYEIIG